MTQDHLARILMPLQEADGSWWDYPFYDYHQGWGTAFAMMSLWRCRKASPATRPVPARPAPTRPAEPD